MPANQKSLLGTYRSWYAAVALTAALGASAVAAPVRATSTVPALIPAVGKTLHYRITRTAQGNTGPRTAQSNVTLHRKSATTLTLQGLYDRPADTNVLSVGTDGMLQPAATDKAGKDDASLVDVVNGLNRLTAIFAGESNIPHDGWSAKLRLPEVHGATAPVVIPIAIENVTAGDFEVHGVGQLAIEAQAARSDGAIARGFGPRGFRVPGAFAGGPLPGDPSGGAAGGIARPAISVAVSVDGRVRRGAFSKFSIVETRSTTVDALPYVNVSGWTIESGK